ncbi:glutathione peroxidase [Paenibacillus swuensis]|uniref:Glutathione peroxidase n=1 Tax=Paenibacillus swuensis TaxID=1178515 RepID=A0A172TEF1_9BACL|nr:glutathione peroxidase [Paenibacillus swuensis]ANE45163.1 glutathione peroxidase [Paenibacillus swuensis]
MSIYSFTMTNIKGQEISLDTYKGQPVVIVNTASKCGLTPQYTDLQKLYDTYKDRGLVILGFPCNQFGAQEPGTNDEVDSFCQVNYGVSFPMFEKIDVRDATKDPLFAYLTETAPTDDADKEIKWNFTKFLIDREGNVVKRFEPQVTPLDMESDIQALL